MDLLVLTPLIRKWASLILEKRPDAQRRKTTHCPGPENVVLEQILIQQQLGVPTLTQPCHGHLSPPQSCNGPLINKRIHDRNQEDGIQSRRASIMSRRQEA